MPALIKTEDTTLKNPIPPLNFLFFSTLAAMIIWLASTGVKAFPLSEYEARYTVNWHGLYAGESVHTLHARKSKETGKNEAYHFETRTEPRLKFLPYRYVESSDFIWQSGRIYPQDYYYDIQEGRRNKKGHVSFDWKANKLTNNTLAEPWEAILPPHTQDKLTQTLSLRHALKTGASLHYIVAEEDKLKNYPFTRLGEEKLHTRIGVFNTVKVSHLSNRGNLTLMWLAKELDYVPVKMIQKRQGKQVASGEILSFHVINR